ncbi:hypothetical protein JCM9279_001943 [Rhodotorula babjevae]
MLEPDADPGTTALDTLRALFPDRNPADLAAYLASAHGNLDRAFRAIDARRPIVHGSHGPTKRARTAPRGLDAWIRPAAGSSRSRGGDSEVLVLSDSDDDAEPRKPRKEPSKSAFDVLRSAPAAASPSGAPSTSSAAPPPPPPAYVSLPPLILHTPALVAKHTRGLVTLVEDALPPELAARLFARSVRESRGEGPGGEGPWTKNKWYLVDREVESPHTSCFFREVPDKLAASSGYDPAAFDESAQYWYNGAHRAARAFTPDMDEARQLVGEFVRVLLDGRARHELEWDGEWRPNVAVANCYRGAKESVGFHSDVLQYLGPYPTIASLTLGVTRTFRLRPFLPSRPAAPGAPPREVRTLDIPLRHNALLVMHAGCQERFKHAVPPVRGGMDLFRVPRAAMGGLSGEERREVEGKGFRERINLTFRHYRPDYAPLSSASPPGYTGTPKCACGVPCTLRPDGRGRARASRQQQRQQHQQDDAADDDMMFFWVCNAGAQNEGRGCGFWRELDPTRNSTNDISVARTTASPSPEASGSGSRAGDADELPEGRESEAGPAAKGKKGKDKDKKGTGKTSQRPSWSCTECTRRKIRCDRVVPGCNQCIKRNKVHLCRLDQDAEMGFAADGSLPAPAAHPAAPTGPPRLASATEYEAISRNIQVVRQRLYHLERVVRAFVPQPDSLDSQGNAMWGVDLNLLQHNDHPTAGPSAPGSTPSFARDSLPLPPPPSTATTTSAQPRDSEVEAATTLEFLALGRDSKESHFRRSELRRPSSEDDGEDDGLGGVGGVEPGTAALAAGWTERASPASRPAHSLAADAATPKASSSSMVDVLPSVETSVRLIDYSLDKVLWQHGTVHSGQFRRECAEFYSWGERRGEKVNQAWLALYLAMLAVAVKHMVADDAPSFGYSSDEQQQLAKRWFDASVAALHRSNFMAKHQIYAVQAINLYAVSCQDIGESDLIATLLAAGIRIAQHLKMHLFGDDAAWDAKRRKNGVDPASDEGVKGLIEREIRKRVWYGLLTEDWISLHGRRAYAVSPTHFTTPLPLNCTDDDLSSGILVNRTKDEPTPASKTILLFHVADVLRRFFEHIHSSKQLDYAYCIEADRALRGVILNGPSFLKVESGPGSGDAAGAAWPEWTAWFRSYWIISVSHKLLVVHRMFVAPAGQQQDERQMYSRRVTIEAARSVIQQLARSPRASTQSYWTLPYHTVSAATSIMLDIFQSPGDPDVPNKRLEVQHALHELQQLAGGSHIAKRGVALLSTLLDEEARHRAPAADDDPSASAAAAGGSHGTDLARAGPAGLPLGSPSMTSLTTPFFIPTLSSAPPAPSSALPFLPAHAPTAAPAPASAADVSAAGLATAPLSHEALHALFAGLGGESAFSHEALVGGGGGDVGGLDLSFGGVGEDPAAVDFWRLLNAGGGGGGGGGGEEFGGEGVVGMTGIEGGMGEWAVWPQ